MSVCCSLQAYVWPCDFSGSDGMSMDLCTAWCPGLPRVGGVGTYLCFCSGLQEDMAASLFSIQVPLVWQGGLIPAWAGDRGTSHGEVSTHILFPLGAGPEPARGKGGVRIAKLLPGRGRTEGGLPTAFSTLFLPSFPFP